MAASVTAIRGDAITVTTAADAFLSSSRMANPNTRRAYVGAIDRTVEILGGCRLLADIAGDDLPLLAVIKAR